MLFGNPNLYPKTFGAHPLVGPHRLVDEAQVQFLADASSSFVFFANTLFEYAETRDVRSCSRGDPGKQGVANSCFLLPSSKSVQLEHWKS